MIDSGGGEEDDLFEETADEDFRDEEDELVVSTFSEPQEYVALQAVTATRPGELSFQRVRLCCEAFLAMLCVSE